MYERRRYKKNQRKSTIKGDAVIDSLEREISALKFFQNISEKKQVSLLHSALRGRIWKEAQEFLSNLFLVKKKWNLTNKFRTLTNKAYPNVFLYDLKSDLRHFSLSLDNFDFVNFEYLYFRAQDIKTSKIKERSSSFYNQEILDSENEQDTSI